MRATYVNCEVCHALRLMYGTYSKHVMYVLDDYELHGMNILHVTHVMQVMHVMHAIRMTHAIHLIYVMNR